MKENRNAMVPVGFEILNNGRLRWLPSWGIARESAASTGVCGIVLEQTEIGVFRDESGVLVDGSAPNSIVRFKPVAQSVAAGNNVLLAACVMKKTSSCERTKRTRMSMTVRNGSNKEEKDEQSYGYRNTDRVDSQMVVGVRDPKGCRIIVGIRRINLYGRYFHPNNEVMSEVVVFFGSFL